jgi:hypothetical protein
LLLYVHHIERTFHLTPGHAHLKLVLLEEVKKKSKKFERNGKEKFQVDKWSFPYQCCPRSRPDAARGVR